MPPLLHSSQVRFQQGARRTGVAPLQQGDRLTRAQFLERYAAMPSSLKAERIEGTVYMSAAVSAEFHGVPHADMMAWLGLYRAATPGVFVADNSTISLDLDNDPQPDACLFISQSCGGRTELTEEGYLRNAPELIVEIAASSLSYDLGAKLNAYRRNAVLEYIVYRAYDGELDWFVLHGGEYQRLAPDSQGVYRSEVFPGLWLDARAFIAGDLSRVLATAQQGVAAPEHAEFVRKIEEQRREK